MIGGHDLVFVIQIEPELALGLVCDAAMQVWPDCVIEDSERRKPVARLLQSFELSGVGEIMIFKDAAFREKWRAKGATSETEDTMIYALASVGELTLAVCAPDKGDVKKIVSGFRLRLKQLVGKDTAHGGRR